MSLSEKEIQEAMEVLAMVKEWDKGNISDDQLVVNILADAIFAERELCFE